MASYNRFQSSNNKFTCKENRIGINEFNPTIQMVSESEKFGFENNIEKWKELIGYLKWMPDLFWDLITPETGSIHLDLDQRVFLRADARFSSVYEVYSRGYGKTFLEFLSLVHTAIFYPNIHLAMTAQTKDQSARLIKEKYNEVIRYYPLIKNEIYKANLKDLDSYIEFNNGSIITNAANDQNIKGSRFKRLKIEESALLNNKVFEDALEPTVEVPRPTIGKTGEIDPEELNWKIDFYTTAGYKNSKEYTRLLKMIDEMVLLKGSFVCGASWELASLYGRGSPRAKIMQKKSNNNPIFFAQNYESEWVGATMGAIVKIDKLIESRVLIQPELKGEENGEYIMGVDVARSDKDTNCQTSITIGKIIRKKNGKISHIEIPNIITCSGDLNFTVQSREIKKIKELYNARVVVVDDNGLGIGLSDALLKDDYDINTGKSLGCWSTLNTERTPEIADAERCLYCLKAQSAQSEIAYNVTEMFESGKVRLLQRRESEDYDVNDKKTYMEKVLPFIQTDFLENEISNLRLAENEKTKKLSIEPVVQKMAKDRFSSLIYMLWYANSFMDRIVEQDDRSDLDYLTKYIMW